LAYRKAVSIVFLDMQSRKVSESIELGKLGEGLHSKRIPMPDLPSGIYFIECNTSQGKLLKKIVVN
jgi:hypothetical protein